jgi:predicted kinase
MKGVSCSGKSTYAQKLAQNENAIIVSSDEIGAGLGLINEPNSPEVFNIMEQKASEYLRKGQNIILDATSLTKKRTNRWIQLAKRFKAEAICVFIILAQENLRCLSRRMNCAFNF